MLPSQRALFDVPREICYLNAASWSPIPLAVQQAGRDGAARKGRPWLLDVGFAVRQHERARAGAARLINADPRDVALISSVSYGVATAAKALVVPPGTRVLVLEDDHASPVLEWTSRAQTGGFTAEAVKRPGNGDWTEAVLTAIARPGAAPVALASISSVHWSDGGVVDIGRVAPALRASGAALLLDATQSVGVLPLDVGAIDPDFVVFPTYKWLLGPYGRAFLYVARRHQGCVPLEQTAGGRRAVRAEQTTYMADTAYLDDARRFDMGERDHLVSLEMASVGIEMMTAWGAGAVAERLSMLTTMLAAGLADLDVEISQPRVRSPHILSLGFAHGMPAGLIEALAARSVYVAPRLDRLRISPHVYNDEADVDRFLAAFRNSFAQLAGRR
jgi:selenocysteine lyase/cysteine desulfurase